MRRGISGRRRLSYEGFAECGVKIVAAFDRDEQCLDREHYGRVVRPMEKLPKLCKRMSIHIGIIAVPDPAAQEVCNLLVANGIRAVWSFAPMRLLAASEILVQNENMAVSPALLSQHLAARWPDFKGSEGN